MTIRGRFLTPLLLLAVLILCPSPLFASANPTQAQLPFPRTSWEVTYHAGPSAIPKGTRLKATLKEERLICEGKNARFSMPVASIIDVSSNSRRRFPMWEAQAKAWGVWAEATEGYGLAFFPYGVPLLLASLTVKSRDYLLDIVWGEGGVEQDIALAIGQRDYSSFLAELNRATGKQWKDLEAEWQRIEQEIKREKFNRITVRLDREAQVAGIKLKPGIYQIVFLPRQGNLGEVYFFKGHAADTAKIAALTVASLGLVIREADLRHKEIATSSKIEVEARPSSVATAQVIYKQKDMVGTIAEIRTANKTFRFP